MLFADAKKMTEDITKNLIGINFMNTKKFFVILQNLDLIKKFNKKKIVKGLQQILV